MKVVIANAKVELILAVELRASSNQVTVVGRRQDIVTDSGYSHLAWINENGDFVVNDAALERLGLKLKHALLQKG